MKARDVIAAGIAVTKSPTTGKLLVGRNALKRADAILAALLSSDEATRLELARALVKAEGWRVVKVPDDVELTSRFGDDAEWISWRQGHNACRAATLASEGNGSE